MTGTPDNMLTRYPAGGVLARALPPAALLAGALAAAGAAASGHPGKAVLTGSLAAACVAASSAAGAGVCAALGGSDRGSLAFLVLGASLARKLVLLACAAAAQLALHPAPVPFWLSIVAGFVFFSVAEIRLLRPVLNDAPRA